MPPRLARESSPIGMALVFALGLVVILSAVAVVFMDRKVSGLEGRLGAIEGRLDAIEGRLGAIETRLGANEGRLGAVEERLRETGPTLGGNP